MGSTTSTKGRRTNTYKRSSRKRDHSGGLPDSTDQDLPEISKEVMDTRPMEHRIAGMFTDVFWCPHCNRQLTYQLLLQAHR